MQIQEFIPLGPKTTMRIGGKARWYADILTEQEAEEAYAFAKEKNIPLIVLGGGSNTIFADDIINALVVRIKVDTVTVEGGRVVVHAGKILGSFVNEMAAHNLDLSALTGIPGTVGGAIFGNAGQGVKGIWINAYIGSVTALIDGQWEIFTQQDCDFCYRESKFKDLARDHSVIIWSATMTLPVRPSAEAKAEIERLIKKRIETQPHLKTAGSCFKSLPDGTPAWRLIDTAGLRGIKVGGIQIAEKHANFLLNVEKGTFEDVLEITKLIREKIPQIAGIEMRLYDAKGGLAA